MNAKHSEVVKKGLLCSSSTSKPYVKTSQSYKKFAFFIKNGLFSVIFDEKSKKDHQKKLQDVVRSSKKVLKLYGQYFL